MVQRTFYALPSEAPDIVEWEPAPDDVHTLKYGYNLADLDRLTRAAMKRGWGLSHDYHVRYEQAWSGIAECLYAADEAPTPSDLIFAGQDAISRYNGDQLRHHGITQDGQGRPRFAAYWETISGHRSSPEAAVIERVALWQIWPCLGEGHRKVLAALAAHGDYQAAADAIGTTYSTFCARVHQARKQFLRLWHQHEEPSGVWGADRRVHRRGDAPVTERRLTVHDHLKGRTGRKKAEIPHGASRYVNHGCRCLECTEAIRIVRLEHARKSGAQPRRIITPDVREQIAQRRRSGVPVAQVAAEFQVSVPLVYKVMKEQRAVPQ